jgi:hypothetical protein
LFNPIKADDNKFSTNDEDWHVIPVPGFWNPARNWLHLQGSNLPHPGSGVSDNYWQKEQNRCEDFTFDYENTSAGWYHHWIEIPELEEDKIVELNFDAISKVSELWVNGKYFGQHIGMFGNWKVDITDAIKQGKNLIAVKVQVRLTEVREDAENVVGRAVSVDITNDMLNSLPHGMFNGTEGGIWQPVTLTITNRDHFTDIFANVDHKSGQIEFMLSQRPSEKHEIIYSIKEKDTAETFIINTIRNFDETNIISNLGNISPKTWSPEDPNLYELEAQLLENDKLIDSKTITFGFRSFIADENKFVLNGNPYWVRGANHPPCGISPNDEKVANTFLKSMHENNQMVTRSHGCPFTKTWLEAADQQGVGVSFEGTWPWMMIGDMPSQKLLDIWKSEMLSLVKKYRNHPSILIWTMNNEMYFTMFNHNKPKDIRLAKWKFLSDTIKEIRKLSPKRPICADSGYSRVQKDYDKNLKPNDIDDGDIDDRHIYPGWYNRDFYQFKDGEWAKRIYWSPGANSNRPFLSQETSTGYPNNDTGHGTRKYLYKHYVPQALVGDLAWEDRNPKYFLKRHAFLTKELAEQIRRSSVETAGLMLFANVCWYKNAFDTDKIEEYPVVKEVKKAYNDVLVSLELFGRHYYAGDKIKENLYVVNNSIDGKKLTNLGVSISIEFDGKTIAQNRYKLKDTDHFDKVYQEIELWIPESLPETKAEYLLKLELFSNGKTISHNSYPLTIAENSYVEDQQLLSKKIALFDPTKKSYSSFNKLGIKPIILEDLTEIRLIDYDILVIANIDYDNEVPYNWEDVQNIVKNGQKILLIHPGKHLQWLLPNRIENIYERTGRMVSMEIPESPIFDSIEPLELSYWQSNDRDIPISCKRSFNLKTDENTTKLAYYLRPHVYLAHPDKELPNMSGYPLIEFKLEKGNLIACEMMLNMADKDPIAGKLFINILNYLLN